MSKPPAVDLSVRRSLELLGQVTKTVADYAEKEKQLERKLRSSGFKSTRKYQEEIEATEAKLAAQQAEITANIENEEGPIRAIAEHRRAKVKRMHLVATKQNPRRGLAVREGWAGDQQMRKIVLKQRLAADQQAVEGEFAEFFARLGEEKAKLTELRKKLERYSPSYRSFRKMFQQETEPLAKNGFDNRSHDHLLQDYKSQVSQIETEISTFFRHSPRLWIRWIFLLIAILFGTVFTLAAFKQGTASPSKALLAYAAAFICGLWLCLKIIFNSAQPRAEKIAQSFVKTDQLRHACRQAAKAAQELAHRNLQTQFERAAAELDAQSARAPEIQRDFIAKAQAKIDAQLPRLLTKIDAQESGRLARAKAVRQARLTDLQTTAQTNIQQLRDAQAGESSAAEAEEKEQWEALYQAWQSEILPLYDAVNEMNAVAAPLAPAWDAEFVEAWQPATGFHSGTAFARLAVDMSGQNPAIPALSRLTLPGLDVGVEALADSGINNSRLSESAKASTPTSLPLVLTFPQQASLLFETPGSGEKPVTDTLNNLILQLLTTIPPGKLSFTIIDPVGLGQNFAGLMHLADYEESLINRRIWTQRDQIEERLEELSEHIEKVIQMYLRNEYATITEYNAQAGSVAEKYQFLVIADFPANFSESAARRLQSIAASGPRCGIFTLIHRDTRQPLPEGFNADELRRNSVCIRREGSAYIIGKEQTDAGATLVFHPPPTPALAVELVHKIGQGSIDSNRVQVPFRQIAPKDGEFWTNDTTNELKIAVGRTGATKHQYLAIGKGTRQHALFAGKTGSGKSTLFHVIITNLALACSPEQVEFWLIDFKKGVEFKCYATKRLPHARVIAIESDREFALSVLQRVDGELKRRGDMFRKLGVQDIAGYQRAGGTEPMPRSLLLIDEFQEFFTEDDTIAQTASLLFDRIVRQGRAFGIHVLLGSQTLGGAYSLARATLGQMVIRVALQCNEADAYLIMDENNSAPRLLSRPGEGIYNDAAGAVEGNSPFQVVWLPDEERDQWLDKVLALNASSPRRRLASPIIFEGNAPADIRENDLLREVLETKPTVVPVAARCWLGAPNSIKGPTEVVFNRQSGNHLLIVGQRDEAAITMLGVSLIALTAQYPSGTARFVLVHASVPGSPDAVFLDEVVAAVPKENLTVSRGGDLAEIMDSLASDLKARLGSDAAGDAPSVFLLIHGLHKFKKLRQEDDFSFSMSDETAANPGTQFAEIITEGSNHGLHILTTVDTLNNVNRCLSRKAQSEFELRVVFQMSANDSASLIDSPKASNLGLHRALLHNEHEGSLEIFRPYATPDAEWLREAREKFSPQSPS